MAAAMRSRSSNATSFFSIDRSPPCLNESLTVGQRFEPLIQLKYLAGLRIKEDCQRQTVNRIFGIARSTGKMALTCRRAHMSLITKQCRHCLLFEASTSGSYRMLIVSPLNDDRFFLSTPVMIDTEKSLVVCCTQIAQAGLLNASNKGIRLNRAPIIGSA
jgi:hypothetical protein